MLSFGLGLRLRFVGLRPCFLKFGLELLGLEVQPFLCCLELLLKFGLGRLLGDWSLLLGKPRRRALVVCGSWVACRDRFEYGSAHQMKRGVYRGTRA